MLPSSDVLAPSQLGSAGYSLAAVFAWGTSDFLGGYCTRRANAFLFTAIVNVGGLAAMLSLALLSHNNFPSLRAAAWVLGGGVAGGAALAIFYRALASGKMGLTAPVSAVLSAAIPTLFSIFTEGWPGPIRMAGFLVAATGLWLITRTEDGASPEGIGLALLAGIGFSAFYMGVREAGPAPALWVATLTRTGGLLTTGSVALLQRRFDQISLPGAGWAVITGCIDSLGTILFVYASRSGRLDEAVVISSLYPAVTVLLARLVLKEHFTRWRFAGLVAALVAVPLIAAG